MPAPAGYGSLVGCEPDVSIPCAGTGCLVSRRMAMSSRRTKEASRMAAMPLLVTALSFFMNKFRKLGLIDYDIGKYDGGLKVHSSLLNMIVHD
jgi:hypothetical protein